MKGDAVPIQLENILLIANPASQNGNGAHLAEEAMETLFRRMTDASIEVILTTHPHHATELAADAAAFDTVIALGGDGLVLDAAAEGAAPTVRRHSHGLRQ